MLSTVPTEEPCSALRASGLQPRTLSLAKAKRGYLEKSIRLVKAQFTTQFPSRQEFVETLVVTLQLLAFSRLIFH